IENYGYFQLCLFYCSYTGFLHFGIVDGALLRYGGKYYNQLNKRVFSGQFWLLATLEIFVSLIVCVVAVVYIEGEKGKIWFFVGMVIALTIPRYFLQFILQATNRIKEYAFVVVIEKVVYLIGVLICLGTRQKSWQPFVAADFLGKGVALIYCLVSCKEIVFRRPASLLESFRETKENIIPGIKITFATVASMLIIGFVRISIENQWDVETFGKVSLTMSVSNLLMIFINAVALVMFPMLRRTDPEKLSGIYNTMRTCLMIPLLGMLVFYYPIKVVLSAWLPQYADSLVYMALLFPMCVFESKMSMLIATYMKALRKEKWLLLVNIATLILSIVITIVTVFWQHNLNLAVASIVFVLAFRCVFAELLLSTTMEIYVHRDILLELLLTIVFIISSWFVGGLKGLVFYVVAYFAYLFVKRKDIEELVCRVNKYIRR
uniref:lipopolysaccharide biosynthesis protein n=1 Tax=Allofournierella sp. TaxID=1940256 RepID=UPI003AB6EF6E